MPSPTRMDQELEISFLSIGESSWLQQMEKESKKMNSNTDYQDRKELEEEHTKEESLCPLGLELSSSCSWSDADDYSETAELCGSLVAAREHASRVGSSITIDKMETLKQELSSANCQLRMRTEEVEKLDVLLDQHSTTMGHLELERDLLRADAEKLEADLSDAIEKSGHIRSVVAGGDDRKATVWPTVETSHFGKCRTRPILLSGNDGKNKDTSKRESATSRFDNGLNTVSLVQEATAKEDRGMAVMETVEPHGKEEMTEVQTRILTKRNETELATNTRSTAGCVLCVVVSHVVSYCLYSVLCQAS